MSRRPSGGKLTPLELKLLILLRAEPAHAYRLALKTDPEISAAQAARRGLSPILKRLEAAELVEGSWVTDSNAGPPHREYRLTGLGAQALAKAAENHD